MTDAVRRPLWPRNDCVGAEFGRLVGWLLRRPGDEPLAETAEDDTSIALVGSGNKP